MANGKLTKSEKKLATQENRIAKMRRENQAAIDKATRTALTMGGALAMAYYKGRNPDRADILGVDAALVIGGGLTIAAMMGWAGNQETAVEALGTGALATFAATKGFEMGAEAAQDAT